MSAATRPATAEAIWRFSTAVERAETVEMESVAVLMELINSLTRDWAWLAEDALSVGGCPR
jgi:hypothetical protein